MNHIKWIPFGIIVLFLTFTCHTPPPAMVTADIHSPVTLHVPSETELHDLSVGFLRHFDITEEFFGTSFKPPLKKDIYKEVKKTLEAYNVQLRNCDPKLGDQVNARIYFSGVTGIVIRVEILGEAKGTNLGKCMKQMLTWVRFPRFEQASIAVDCTFTF